MHPPKTPALTDAAASFACPSCRALYEVSVQRLSLKDKGQAQCLVCGNVMIEWDSAHVPFFRLVARPSPIEDR